MSFRSGRPSEHLALEIEGTDTPKTNRLLWEGKIEQDKTVFTQ